MEVTRATPPPYSALSPNDYGRPPLPPDEMVEARRAQADITLPDLKTVLSPEFQHSSPEPDNAGQYGSPSHSVRSLPRIEPGRHANDSTSSMDAIVASPAEGTYPTLHEHMRYQDPSNTLTGEQLKMREAAEALAGLGNSNFAKSPTSSHMQAHATSANDQQQAEPLLHLLTQAHPFIGGAAGGALKAYAITKSYTPGFVQAGANMVERNIATPMISTVGSVGRYTGVEQAARWYLTPNGTRQEISTEDEEAGRGKRRRIMSDDMDVEAGLAGSQEGARRESQDSRLEFLPAYRASKPPSYREEASPATTDRAVMRQRPMHNRTWSQQVIVSAGGLGVALSDRSRQTLAFCLNFLGRNAEHIATVTNALKLVLEQYDQARDQFHQNRDSSLEKGERPRTPDHDDASRRLAELMKKHCDDISQTLKQVVTSVSETAGGALPTNARAFVRGQLLSLPRRWQRVASDQTGESETSRNAHRMIAFATEGLDMMAHVGHACKATLDSAEAWLKAVGRRPQEQQPAEHHDYRDEKMGNGGAEHAQ
ncbi:transcriptional regulator opi1 [Recurvomyces mirabilis]|uniref:Transcriptional regulator opi1 n=1 Tax=Recurvomyces mirabilis TaxID=574656 RepID=A0AAE0WXT5_9PEZI|nr:transcriptional regulator opi1 [Recurvomyces mirabilis]KAK5161923.1 transcriptional regulator opi1 [Recurvomyces mirabilis]